MRKKISKILLIVMVIAMAAILMGSTVFAERDEVGDLNRDGEKNSEDVIYLLKHSFRPGAYPVDQPCDYNGDGKVNSDDAIYLLRHIFRPQDFHICDYPDQWKRVEEVPATCVEGGYIIVECECGKTERIDTSDKSNVHTFDWKNSEIATTKAPTCLENGIETVTCKVCGEATETRETQAIGHDYRGGDCETGAACFNCGDTLAPEGHKYPTEPTSVVDPSCKPGYKKYVCTAEGCESFIEETIEATREHSAPEGAWSKVSENPVEGENCTFELIESATCECGETITRSTKFTKHTEVVEVVPATCVKDGYRKIYCSECEDEFKYEIIARPTNKAEIAHTWNEGVVDGNVTTFTCTTEGCGETKTTVAATEDGKVDIGAAEEVVLNNGAAIVPDDNLKEEFGGKDVSVKVDVVDTSKDLGLSDENKEILESLGDKKIYDFSMMVGDESITNFGEKDGKKLEMTVRIPYELVEGDDPDCILIWYINENGDVTSFTAKYVDGYAVFTTTHFSYYTVVRMTPAERCAYYKTHVFERTVVPATCVTGGYTLDVCTRCGHKETSNETEALGHVWDIKTFESTCTVAGRTVKTCKACEIVYTELGTALGHKMSETPSETVTPTCTAKGKNVYRCTNEGCEYFTVEEIAMLGHDYKTTTVEPTCTEAGYTTTKCQRCGDETVAPIAALGHNYVDSICSICNVECAHEFEYGVCKYCNKVKEKPVVPEVCKHPSFTITYEFLNADKKICSEGVSITENCTNCDYKYTYTKFECYTWHVDVDLSGYNVCESHSLSYTTCACGQSLKFDGVNITEMFESGADYAVFGCSKCDLYYRQKLIVSEESCDGYYRHNDFYVGEELIITADQFVNTPVHDVETTYEFVNKDLPYCEYGVIVTETCKKCGNVDTYTENECVMHYVEVVLPDTGHCGTHNLDYFVCPCGLEWEFLDNNGVNLDKEFIIEGEDPNNAMGLACKNEDCGICVIARRSFEKNGCTVNTTVTYSFYCGDELIHTMRFVAEPEIKHDIERTYEFANKDNPSCEYGVIVTEKCKDCGYENTYTTKEHEVWWVEVDISDYAHCGKHNFSYETCLCGWATDFIGDIGFDNVDRSEDGKSVTYTCNDCAMKAYAVMVEKKIGCMTVYSQTMTFYFGEETVYEINIDVPVGIEHDIEYSHEFVNKDLPMCMYGVYITESCKNCDYTNTYVTTECVTREVEVDLSGYNHCGKHNFSYYTCPCGYAMEFIDEEAINLTEFFDPATGEPIIDDTQINEYNVGLACKDCAMKAIITVNVEETDCVFAGERVVTFYFGDEVIETASMCEIEIDHSFVDMEFVLDGDSCKDGFTVKATCSDCGEKVEYKFFDHYDMVIEKTDLSKYGACDSHYIAIYSCPCGENSNVHVTGLDRMPMISGGNVETYYCNECKIKVNATRTYGQPDKNCNVERTTVYEVIVDKNVVETFVDVDEYIEHRYVIIDSVLNGNSCDDGVTVTYWCPNCGDRYTSTHYGHNYEFRDYDMSEYDICDSHNFAIEECVTCGKIEFIRYSFAGGIPMEEIENGWRIECPKCSLVILETEIAGEKDGCMTEFICQTLVYSGDQLILKGETSGWTDNHDWNVELVFKDEALGCEGGVIRIETCKVCGTVNERGFEGHMWRDFQVDLVGRGGCESHYAYGSFCENCESVNYMDIGGFEGWQEIENGEMYFCNDCGMTISVISSVGEKDENCGISVTTSYIICVNKEEVRRFEGTRTEYQHNFKESYTFLGKDCLDGVIITYTCADCGEEITSQEIYSHSYVYEEIDISGYGVCKSHTLTQRVCTVCDAHTHLQLEGGKISTEGLNETTTLSYCHACGLEMTTEIVIVGEMDENCTVPLEFRYTVTFKGETIKTAVGVGSRVLHQYNYEYQPYGPSCEDGYHVIETCDVCGLYNEYDSYSHRMIYNEVYLSEYGACDDHWIVENICELCGYGNFDIRGNNLTIKGAETRRIYTCTECGFQGQITKKDAGDIGNCVHEVATIVSVSINGENVYRKDAIGKETRHTYETSYELLGKTCDEGIKVTNYCINCGISDTYHTSGHEFHQAEIDLSNYKVCKDHIVEVNQCRFCGECGYLDFNGENVLYRSEPDENGNVVRARQWCENCSIEIYYNFTYGDPVENCMVETYTYCDLYIDGEHVASGTTRGFRETHNWQTSYELLDEALGCEGGVRYTNSCINCGREEWGEYNGHQTVSSERYDLADYGHKCGSGTLYFNSCLCGYEKHVSYDIENFEIVDEYPTIDGVDHFIETYTCMSCGYTINRDAYSVKDEYCNAVRYENWTFGGMTVSMEIVTEKLHNETEKLLPDESYTVDNGDGTRTEIYAYERYCKDCKASINKQVYHYTYNENGHLVKEYSEHYDYKAFDDEIGGTVAILRSSNYREYLVVATVNGKDTVALTLLELNKEYSDGVEKWWVRREYVYNGNDYCSYTVNCSNSNGESWTESARGHYNERTRYELSKGSTSCLEGLDRVWFCELCGTVTRRKENVSVKDHMLETGNGNYVNSISFADFGAVCEGALYIYACPCGAKMRAQFESKCDFENNNYGMSDENGVHHQYSVYTCAVSECGFKFVIDCLYTTDGDCKEICNYIYYLGVNETNDAYVDTYSFSYYTGGIRHAEIKTETFIDSNRYYEASSCANCGKLDNAVEIMNGVRTETSYEYHENGNLRHKRIEKSLAGVDQYAYRLLVRSEYYDESGENLTNWSQTEYVYPNAANGDYCLVTITHSSMNNEKGETYTEEDHQWSYHRQCTPGMVTMSCGKCGATKEEFSDDHGHNFYYSSEKGCFVCSLCELESQTDGNGLVGFEDKTLALGNGEKYVIGWYNEYNGEYTWALDLLDTATGTFYELNLDFEIIDEYNFALDANAVKAIANGYGLSDCGYMIVITFVPKDGGELNYSITLDPHAYVLTETFVPEGGCSSGYACVWTYKCSLCGDTYEETRKHHYFEGKGSVTNITVAADGTITRTVSSNSVCRNCGEVRANVRTEVYAPNGQLIKEEYVSNGKLSYSYEYDYDYVNDRYTTTYTSENGYYVEETVRSISTNEIISRKNVGKDGEVEENRYTYIDGREYNTYSYYKYSDGNWRETTLTFDFENGTYTITEVDSYGNRNVSVRYISDDRYVSEMREGADGSSSSTIYDYANDRIVHTYESLNEWVIRGAYVRVLSTGRTLSEDRVYSDGREDHYLYDEVDGVVYQSYAKSVNSDGSWDETRTTVDVENDLVTYTTTYSYSSDVRVSKRTLSTGRELCEETVFADGSKSTTEYDYDNDIQTNTHLTTDGVLRISTYRISKWEHLYTEVRYPDGSWQRTTYSIDEANDRRTETTVNSDGKTIVAVYTISNYDLVSRDVTYKDGSWERTTVVVDEALGKIIETTESSKGLYHRVESDVVTRFVTLEIRREEDGRYTEVRHTVINGGTQSRTTYRKTIDAEGTVHIREWMLRGEETYLVFDSYESAEGYKRVSEYSYDFDNDICTETRTENDVVSVIKTKISTGELIEDEPTPDRELTITEANNLGAQQEHNTYTEEKYYVTGTVTEIVNATYGNLYITDGENAFYVYGLYNTDGIRFDSMNFQPVVGDIITVYGMIGQYNGTPQMKNATLISISSECAHANSTFLETVASDCFQQGGDVYFCNDCGKSFATNFTPALGHALTYLGYVEPSCSEYGGDKYYCKRCDSYFLENTVDIIDHDYSTAETYDKAFGDITLPFIACVNCGNETIAPDSTLTIKQANYVGSELFGGAYTVEKFYVTGTITEITNLTFGNAYITDGEDTFYIYGLYSADGEVRFDAMDIQPAVGDTITVYGIIGQYNGTPQMKNGYLIEMNAA